jgi:hypothetical protein
MRAIEQRRPLGAMNAARSYPICRGSLRALYGRRYHAQNAAPGRHHAARRWRAGQASGAAMAMAVGLATGDAWARAPRPAHGADIHPATAF